MQKYLKNNLTITAVLIISSVLITILYYFKDLVLPNAISFVGNIVIIFSSILGIVLCGSVFLLAIDAMINRNIRFKERLFYTIKSLCISQFMLLPVILILLLINVFVDLEFSIINKIVVFSISYLSQICLFFSYKLVTKSNWSTTIKVVASQSILAILLSILLKFI